VTIHPLTLILIEDTFAICRLKSDDPLPNWVTTDSFFSITRTPDELSIVCRQDTVPQGMKCEAGWRCLRIAGMMPFSLTGVLASLVTPLAEAAISVFAISTFDTDYLLVKESGLDHALNVLREAGHLIQ
jgi:hypothetical protein